MAEERAGSWDGSLGGGSKVSIDLDGDVENFGGEELGDISWRGLEHWVAGCEGGRGAFDIG